MGNGRRIAVMRVGSAWIARAITGGLMDMVPAYSPIRPDYGGGTTTTTDVSSTRKIPIGIIIKKQIRHQIIDELIHSVSCHVQPSSPLEIKVCRIVVIE
jgi:hypothetical protein